MSTNPNGLSRLITFIGSSNSKSDREDGSGRCHGGAEGDEEQYVNPVHSQLSILRALYCLFIGLTRILCSSRPASGSKL